MSPLSVAVDEPADRPISRSIYDTLETGRPQRMRLTLDDPPRGAADLPVTDAIVLPVAGRAEARPLGVLIAGVNPTYLLDDDYTAFFELVASNIGTAIQNARAVEEEKRRADMLAEMDRAKTVFFSNISHEFRTPLTLMLGPLEQLQKRAEPGAQPLVETARRNALRLLKLVNALLEFSRLEAGRSDAVFSATNLAALTRDVASTFRSAIESAGLRFVIETHLDEPVFVDRSMWERIILNLLSNALKFTFRGEIEIALRRQGNMAALSVTDTGVGIAAEDLPQLFERFHRVRGAKSRTHEGTGIGLALVRDLAALHGGTVDVRSEAGRGTTFTVRVPLGKDHLDASKIVTNDSGPFASSAEQYLADLDATVMQNGAAHPITALLGTERARVLLADDNADLREYVTDILKSRYDVMAVTNGREALEAAKSGSYDLIVSDVMMPEMDGFELLQALRSDAHTAATPVVLLSARAGEESSLEGLMKGADDYIVKPFSAEELLARVHAQINAASVREHATRELRASEERFRTLAASLPYIVFECDASGDVTFFSDEFQSYTGMAAESGNGRAWTELIHPDDAAEVVRGWSGGVISSDAFSAEFRMRRHDLTYRWFTARALPQHGADGRVTRWTGTMTDVHDQRQAARERDFLLRASEIFARPLDLDTTLQAIARFAVPELGDWCQIDLRTDDGRIKTVAMAHRDPIKDRIAQQFVGRIHLNVNGAHGSPYVIRTGKSEILPFVSHDVTREAVGNEEETRMYVQLGLRSVVAVPLVAEGQTLGMLAVLTGDSNRVYSHDDVPMLEELGRRAGLALHKARLFEREHRAAESFQQASLPATLPNAPGLRIDAFYAPGRAEAQVGGDWYDAVRLVDGRVVISIGDVAGSGLDAAVTMGNMRQIIRGIAQVHADPALMLDAADRALRLEHPEKFATAFVGVFDVITNTLTYASAGHPPPIVRQPDGTVEMLRDTGLPLGLRSNDTHAISRSVQLAQGACMVLYTDGLTEFERKPEDGENRLRTLVHESPVSQSERAAKALVESVMLGRAARDDVAVLVALVEAPPAEALQRWSFTTDDIASVGAARAAFRNAFHERGGSPDDVSMAELVFGELVSNTVRYAPGRVEVIADWSGAQPVLHVLDGGPGFRHIAILPPDLLSESGRGLFIVSALTEDFRVSKRPQGGSHARAVLRLQSRQLVSVYGTGLSHSLLHKLTDRVSVTAE